MDKWILLLIAAGLMQSGKGQVSRPPTPFNPAPSITMQSTIPPVQTSTLKQSIIASGVSSTVADVAIKNNTNPDGTVNANTAASQALITQSTIDAAAQKTAYTSAYTGEFQAPPKPIAILGQAAQMSTQVPENLSDFTVSGSGATAVYTDAQGNVFSAAQMGLAPPPPGTKLFIDPLTGARFFVNA